MANLEAKKPAAESARGLPENVQLGRQNSFVATTIRPESQAFPRITARVENHIREVESRVIRLGQLVDVDQADRSMIVERLGVAIELARLDVEVPP
jgi:hypothetical protein